VVKKAAKKAGIDKKMIGSNPKNKAAICVGSLYPFFKMI